MLANSLDSRPQAGKLGQDVQLKAASLYELLDFIANELPVWRDRPEREQKSSETTLTSQLCGHLSSAARRSHWDFLQFRVEEPDELAGGRRIDLIAAPCDAVVWIDSRCCYDMQTLLPIECKRLPTPIDEKRDEREYVFSGKSSTGGIQRFKGGKHAAMHDIAAMIGYVQENDHTFWHTRICEWITELHLSYPEWSVQDSLTPEFSDESTGLSIYRSKHARQHGRPIQLRHLWIKMPSAAVQDTGVK